MRQPDVVPIRYDPQRKAEIEERCTCAWMWGFDRRGKGVRSHVGMRNTDCPMHGDPEAT